MPIKMPPALALLAFTACLVLARPAFAHHSFSMYDSEKLLKLDGKIQEFQWTNPHAIVWVKGRTSPEQPEELWTVELPTSPGNLSRMGWKRNSLAPGDPVIIELNPLRDGRRGGSFKKATVTSTGAVLVANVRDEPPSPGAAGASAQAGDDHDHDHEEPHQSGGSGCTLGAPSMQPSAVYCLGLLALARRARGRRRSRHGN